MSAVTAVDWYQGHSPLHNVTGFSEDIAEVPVKIDMHGELIDVKGYKSQLLVYRITHGQSKYTACITNDNGVVCEDLQYVEGKCIRFTKNIKYKLSWTHKKSLKIPKG